MSQDLKEELAAAQEESAHASSKTAAGATQLAETNAEVQIQNSEAAADSHAQTDKLERTIRHLDMENRKLKLKLERADKAQV